MGMWWWDNDECLALKSLGLLGVIPRKDKLGVGCLLESKSTGQLVLGTGHLDRLVKVLDSLLDLALLQEQLSKGGNSNIALGIGYYEDVRFKYTQSQYKKRITA